MKSLIYASLIIFSPLADSKQLQLPWDSTISSPEIMGPHFNRTLSELPSQGEVNTPDKLWSGDYWPFFKGSIDYRWYAKGWQQKNDNPPDRSTALKSTIYELTTLSPAEKYDLLVARYDYPLKRWVRSLIPNNPQLWEGICHGWSPASINHDEPRPRIMRNPDGIEIPFSSADIKALLSFYYAFGFEVDNTHQMGKRCEARGFRTTNPDCHNDLNAGAFHIVLANKVGIQNESFVIDNNRLREVWNNPVQSYQSQIIAQAKPLKDSAPGTTKTVRVKTTVVYVDSNRPDWQTILGTTLQKYRKSYYQYYLDIDDKNQIIGGKWIGSDRPDFIWEKRRPARFAGLLSQVGRLLYE